mmetsp:Transcript_11174/g.28627  ORF Transcript_11174/g.28627 Transcript_11174/m.28627 type:complete len:208 (+) Transcript_11174:447-1070(+)
MYHPRAWLAEALAARRFNPAAHGWKQPAPSTLRSYVFASSSWKHVWLQPMRVAASCAAYKIWVVSAPDSTVRCAQTLTLFPESAHTCKSCTSSTSGICLSWRSSMLVSMFVGTPAISVWKQSDMVPHVDHSTKIEKRKVQIGSARYQYEIPFESSQRSWKPQIRPAERHTPSDERMSPMTCAIAARTAILRLCSSSWSSWSSWSSCP